MDWSRAKTYLILTFLLLDIVLGYQYWNVRTEQAGYVQSYAEQLDEVSGLLASQNWELRADVPKMAPDLAYLQVRYLTLSEEEINKRISGSGKLQYKGPGQFTVELGDKSFPVNLDDDNTGEKVLSHFDSRLGSKEIYQYDRKVKENKSNGTIEYLQTYKNYPIFSAPLEVLVEGDKATRYHQVTLNVTGEGGGKKQVISAVHALRSFAESIDKPVKKTDNRVIREIRIGYYSKPFNADEWYLIPMWRILSDKEVYYVNGFTGEVEMAR